MVNGMIGQDHPTLAKLTSTGGNVEPQEQDYLL